MQVSTGGGEGDRRAAELPHVPYAVTADGERLLIDERVGGNGTADYVPVEQSIVVMLNWTAAFE